MHYSSLNMINNNNNNNNNKATLKKQSHSMHESAIC